MLQERIELPISALQVRCSTNWAIGAKRDNHNLTIIHPKTLFLKGEIYDAQFYGSLDEINVLREIKRRKQDSNL